MSVFEMRRPKTDSNPVETRNAGGPGSERATNTSRRRWFDFSEALTLTCFQSVRDPMEFHAYRGIENLNKGRWEFRCLGPVTQAGRRSIPAWQGHVANGILFRAAKTA